MRLTRIELDGVGPFENAVFDFPPPDPQQTGELVLFEGGNGSGKTTLLMAIAMALRPDGNLLSAPFFWSKRRRQPAFVESLAIEHNGETGNFRRDQYGTHSPLPGLVPRLVERFQQVRVNRTGGPVPWGAYSFASHGHTPVVQAQGPGPLKPDYLLRALRFGSGSPQETQQEDLAVLGYVQLGPPLGQLLSNFDYERTRAIAYRSRGGSEAKKGELEAAAQSYEDAIARMERALSDVLDRQVKFDFRLGEPAPRILFDGEELPLDLLGEGLRSTFSWLSDLLIQLLLTPWEDKTRSPLDQDFWLLLDEVDQSLHPQLQMRLFPMLRMLFKNARIYATTHSPFVVASAGQGHVFSIAQDRASRRVKGPQRAIKLEPGQTLERIVSEVFKSPSLFIDRETQQHLDRHEQAIRALRRSQDIDWPAFLADRDWLWQRTEEVRTVAAMREVPVRDRIAAKLRESAQ